MNVGVYARNRMKNNIQVVKNIKHNGKKKRKINLYIYNTLGQNIYVLLISLLFND